MQILAVTSMRNEGPHCLEWIAHHLAAGVDHFLIFSNDCNDGTDLILDALQNTGLVTHMRQHLKGKRTVQWQALKQAADHTRVADADWVLATDCDEFINLRAPLTTLQGLIASLPNETDAVAIPWRLFGHSDRIEMRDQLTLEQFTKAAPTDLQLPLAHFFKSLFRPTAFHQFGVHRPKRHKGTVPNWVDGGGKPLPDTFAKNDARINMFGIQVSTDLVQLNHYSLRSAESFMVKRARGLPNHMEREIGLGYWVERNFNTVTDVSIQHMQPATQAKLDELMQLETVADLHKAAFEKHQACFNQMMSNRADIQLFWHLGLANNSKPPSATLARIQINRIVKAEQNNG